MALEGSLQDFGLADILQLIYFQRKTGVLTLEGRGDRVKLYFVDGNVMTAESKRRAEDHRLGKVLVKKGLLQEKDLSNALDEQKQSGTRLGGTLIRKGLVPKEVIHEILTVQVTETTVQLFGWKQGSYEFSQESVSQDKDLQFSVDTQHLLMEGLRIVDELSVIKDRIRLDAVFRKVADTVEDASDEEAEVFGYVDGQSDVSEIVDFCGRDNYEVSKNLLSLLEKGAIEEITAAPLVSAPAAEAKPSGHLWKYLPAAAVSVSFLLSVATTVMLRGDGPKRSRAAQEIETLRFQAETYHLQHGAYPEQLSVLTNIQDPWGRAYRYEITSDSILISSTGADGKADTADDIL